MAIRGSDIVLPGAEKMRHNLARCPLTNHWLLNLESIANLSTEISVGSFNFDCGSLPVSFLFSLERIKILTVQLTQNCECNSTTDLSFVFATEKAKLTKS